MTSPGKQVFMSRDGEISTRSRLGLKGRDYREEEVERAGLARLDLNLWEGWKGPGLN